MVRVCFLSAETGLLLCTNVRQVNYVECQLHLRFVCWLEKCMVLSWPLPATVQLCKLRAVTLVGDGTAPSLGLQSLYW